MCCFYFCKCDLTHHFSLCDVGLWSNCDANRDIFTSPQSSAGESSMSVKPHPNLRGQVRGLLQGNSSRVTDMLSQAKGCVTISVMLLKFESLSTQDTNYKFNHSHRKIKLQSFFPPHTQVSWFFPFIIKTLIVTELNYQSSPWASLVLSDTSEQKLLIHTGDTESN